MSVIPLLEKYPNACKSLGLVVAYRCDNRDAVTASALRWLLERGAWVHLDLDAYMVTGYHSDGVGCFNTPHFNSAIEAMLWAVDRWDEREKWLC